MLIAGTQEFMLFSLIVMRMTGFVFMNPILGRQGIPSAFKTALSLVLALTAYPMAMETAVIPDAGAPLEYGFLLLKEFAIGYLLGLIMHLFAFVVTYAGSIIDFQMALGMASIYDPVSGLQVALTGNILNMYFMLLFFAVDGHLALMDILITSGEIAPYGQLALFNPEIVGGVIEIFLNSVLLAVKLAIPVVGTVLILDAGVGILMKIIPQINLFIVDIPLKILLGFVMLMFMTTPIGDYLGELISEMMKAVQHSLTTVIN